MFLFSFQKTYYLFASIQTVVRSIRFANNSFFGIPNLHQYIFIYKKLLSKIYKKYVRPDLLHTKYYFIISSCEVNFQLYDLSFQVIEIVSFITFPFSEQYYFLFIRIFFVYALCVFIYSRFTKQSSYPIYSITDVICS